jgi:hypothetical protein
MDNDSLSDAPEVGFVEALEKLVPPMYGVVEQVELRGRIFNDSRRYVLNRGTTKRVKKYLTSYRANERTLVTVEGVVDELDRGRLTFIMRRTDDGLDRTFTFSEEFLDDVMIAFNSSVRVIVSGRHATKKQPIEMLGVDFLDLVPVDDV